MPAWMLIAILAIVAIIVVISFIAMFTEMGTKRTTGTMKGGHKSSGRGGNKSKKKRR